MDGSDKIAWQEPGTAAVWTGLPPGELTVVRLPGLMPYLSMWERQRQLAAARQRDEIGDLLLLLEHPHVYTNGRRGDRAHLLIDEATLAALGAAYHEVDRGGDITYHGPGQLVGYAIVHLERLGLGVRSYVHGLETALIRTAAHFGVEAHTEPRYTGVWVNDEKLVAIGVKVQRGVAYHGFALNVTPDLSYFRRIVPCGIPDRGVTSLTRLAGRAMTVDEVAPVCAAAVADVLGLRISWVTGEGWAKAGVYAPIAES
jgi:lipoyl(octanoyl) transferase